MSKTTNKLLPVVHSRAVFSHEGYYAPHLATIAPIVGKIGLAKYVIDPVGLLD